MVFPADPPNPGKRCDFDNGAPRRARSGTERARDVSQRVQFGHSPDSAPSAVPFREELLRGGNGHLRGFGGPHAHTRIVPAEQHGDRVPVQRQQADVTTQPRNVPTPVVHGEQEASGQFGQPRSGADPPVQLTHDARNRQPPGVVQTGTGTGHYVPHPLVGQRGKQSHLAEPPSELLGRPDSAQLEIRPRRELDRRVPQLLRGRDQHSELLGAQHPTRNADPRETAVGGGVDLERTRTGVRPVTFGNETLGHSDDATDRGSVPRNTPRNASRHVSLTKDRPVPETGGRIRGGDGGSRCESGAVPPLSPGSELQARSLSNDDGKTGGSQDPGARRLLPPRPSAKGRGPLGRFLMQRTSARASRTCPGRPPRFSTPRSESHDPASVHLRH